MRESYTAEAEELIAIELRRQYAYCENNRMPTAFEMQPFHRIVKLAEELGEVSRALHRHKVGEVPWKRQLTAIEWYDQAQEEMVQLAAFAFQCVAASIADKDL